MKKFKQKEYTIQEGHYTGPKDLEKVPGAIEVIGKTSLAGAGIGAGIGGIFDKTGVMENTGILSGAATGGKAGLIAGVAAKILLNSLHKPMKTVKYQEVDKLLRAKFGIYRISGFTTGDTLAKRNTVEEKFAFNSRKIEDFKISFVIQDNKVTMYTLGISDDTLDKLNNSLDYYCKKFSGMEYTSKPINPRTNSYSVTITFTNYKAISDFIFEVSEVTGVKINLLNDGILLERLKSDEEDPQEETKSFSMFLDKYDLLRILTKVSGKALDGAMIGGPKAAWSAGLAGFLKESLMKLKDQELAKYFPSARKNFGSSYLYDRIRAVGGIESIHFTKGEKNAQVNIRLDRGVFIVTSLIGTKESKFLLEILPEESRKEVKGKVNLWSFPISNRGEFDIILTKLINKGVKPNIFV